MPSGVNTPRSPLNENTVLRSITHEPVSRLIPFAVAVLVLAVGSADSTADKIPDDAGAVLEEGEPFELLSLDPERLKEKPKDAFHGWKVLGKTTVKDADVRKSLVAAFKKGVADNKGIVAACFNPRHGIRVTHEGKTTDFVICFECYQVNLYTGEKQEKGFLVTESPQPVFDKVLKDAGVPLAEKPK